MVTISLVLSDMTAEELYSAVGKQLAQGDVTPSQGESQFSASLGKFLQATPPAATPSVVANSPMIAPVATKGKS